jgi:phosphatidylcholine synthase
MTFGWRQRSAAFSVHILTALGAGVALVAALEAARERWAAAFAWLGVALLIDGVDGTLARRLKVERVLPNWSGETLDLIVDYITYVFIPAYIVVESRLLPPIAASVMGVAIVISGALYFADRRMKTEDHHFRGFPALWNLAAFYLLLLRPSSLVATLLIAGLVVLTFTPIRVMHPLRVTRLRPLNIALTGLWLALAAYAIAASLLVPTWVVAALCAIGLYFLLVDVLFRLVAGMRT